MLKRLVILGFGLLCQVAVSAHAAFEQRDAIFIASDFSSGISAATNVIVDLQPAINTKAIYAERIEPKRILAEFYQQFKLASGQTFDPTVGGLIGEYRGYLVQAINEVMEENHDRILAGGQDAFVPAYFRANILKKINQLMGGRLIGNITTSKRNLINHNSAVDIVLKDSPLLKEVSSLVQEEKGFQIDRVVGNHFMSYRPLKLKSSCVSCHNKHGKDQTIGGYGGAFVIDIKME